MKNTNPIFLIICFLIQTVTFSQQTTLSAKFEDYFTLTNKMKRVTTTVNLTGKNNLTDSQTLQNKINQISANGGGTIDIKPANITAKQESTGKKRIYLRNVELRNNIRIRVHEKIIIENYVINNQGINEIFWIGKNGYVENVSITSISNRFTVKLKAPNTGKRRASFAIIGNAKNFSISQAIINDNNTIFASIFFKFANDSERVFSKVPRKGLIYNIKQTSAHSGYGIVQMVAGKKILFHNLDGTGGVTLRIETDGALVSSSKDMTVDQIAGRNININKGLSAVLLSPHRTNQGLVEIVNINAKSSAFGVGIAPGFRGSDNGSGAVANSGSFNANSILKNINITAANSNAQVVARLRGYFRCGGNGALFDNTTQANNDARNLNSVGAIDNRASTLTGCKTNVRNTSGKLSLGSPLKCYNVKIGNVTFNNGNRAEYPSPLNIGINQLIGNCTNNTASNTLNKIQTEFYSNENSQKTEVLNTNNSIIVNTVTNSTILIYNSLGKIVKTINKTTNNVTEIDTTNLSPGIYHVTVTSENKKFTKQIIL